LARFLNGPDFHRRIFLTAALKRRFCLTVLLFKGLLNGEAFTTRLFNGVAAFKRPGFLTAPLFYGAVFEQRGIQTARHLNGVAFKLRGILTVNHLGTPR
jgi:hypothetical protein